MRHKVYRALIKIYSGSVRESHTAFFAISIFSNQVLVLHMAKLLLGRIENALKSITLYKMWLRPEYFRMNDR